MYQITSGESLTFIDDIDLIARYTMMSTNTLYKNIFEFISHARCPVIISCSTIPPQLHKYLDYLQFMHIAQPVEGAAVLSLHTSLVYGLERSGCAPRVLQMLEEKKPIADLAAYWEGCMEAGIMQEKDWDPQKVREVVRNAGFSMDRLFIGLYAAIHVCLICKRV